MKIILLVVLVIGFIYGIMALAIGIYLDKKSGFFDRDENL